MLLQTFLLLYMRLSFDYFVYRMAGPLKTCTGLAGLSVAQYPHRMLSSIYQKILKIIKEMPEDYAYRKNTQVILPVLALTNYVAVL